MTASIRMSDLVLPVVSEPGRAEVRGVFAHGLDVVREDGVLVYLGGYDRALSCVGVQLSEDVLAALLACVRQGDAAELGCARIRFTREGGQTAELDLSGADVVALRLTAPLVPDALADVSSRIAACQLEKSVGLSWDERLREALAGLTYGDAERMEESVLWLYGRGLGLTPSGDDILCGFGCGLAVAGRSARREELLRAIERVARVRNTTYVSEAYLAAMAAGRVNESFFTLVRDARFATVTSGHIAACRELGGTSGDDMLLGFGLALGVEYPGI